MNTSEKLVTLRDNVVTLQDDLEHRVQQARDEIQENIRTLQDAAAKIAQSPGANLGWMVSLATSMKNRATLIEQAALRAQDAQEMVGHLKSAILIK